MVIARAVIVGVVAAFASFIMFGLGVELAARRCEQKVAAFGEGKFEPTTVTMLQGAFCR